ncbi:MAG: S9 family peptidase [Gemmatimonadales bacterium]|nr:S9 family peptidase [Gemmatimonadales bacterium]
MPRRLATLAAPLLALAAASAEPALAQAPPRARIVPKVDTLHGDIRTDDYFWLRDRTNPETIAYLEAENAYTERQTARTAGLRDRLYEEIRGRIRETDLSVPEFDHGYWYAVRTEAGKSYGIIVRRKGTMTAPEEVVLDQNARAEGKKYYGLGAWEVSPSGRLLAFAEDTTALRWYTVRVKDLVTGELLPDVIDSVTGNITWARDERTLFYTLADSARRDNRIVRHVLGTPPAQDVTVFRDDDVLFNVGVSRTRSDRWITIQSASFSSNETHLIPADRPATAPRVVAPRRPDVEYEVEHWGDRWVIVTNDGAPNFRVMQAPEARPERAAWTPLLPYTDSVYTEGVRAFRDFLVLSERYNGLRKLRILDRRLKGRFLEFPEAAYAVFPESNPDWATRRFRYSYSSPVTPRSVFQYDIAAGTSTLLKKYDVLGGYDPSRYTVERFEVRARDGTMVPVSMVYRAPLVKDGRRPLLLYAYGSYGSTTEPGFNSPVVSLLDRGVIYAIAHVRGGQEKGRRWYDDGKMLRKMNTFTDFVDVAQALVDARYTAPERLVANGGSAGGLLMGVIANMRPDLFRAIVADVPFVDVINTMRDASIPLTAQEWIQWGNPAKEDEYRYMLQYSPYDNVAAKAYPWLLVTTSLNDSQVAYWEPAKWTARLRALKTDTNPLLLKTNMAGGHGGASGRYDRFREIAFRFAFMLDALGLAGEATP